MPLRDPEKRSAYNRAYRLAHPESLIKNKNQIRARYAANPEFRGRVNSRSSAWAKANPERHKLSVRRGHYKRTHGITLEQFDALFISQGSQCDICGSTDPHDKTHGWHLDHDHAFKPGDSGYIRGILCAPCNRGLGDFHDNVDALRKAIAYLTINKS
jgi:Recombination endonuclease VII